MIGVLSVPYSPLFSEPYGFIGHIAGNQIDVVDTATNTLLSPITVGSIPEFSVSSLDGTKLFVSNLGSNTVSVINVSDFSITATVDVGTSPQYIAISPDGSTVFVVNTGSSNISWIDVANPSNLNSGAIATDATPNFIAFTPDGLIGIVPCLGSNVISLFNPVTKTFIKNIPTGLSLASNPGFVAAYDNQYAYVSNTGAPSSVSYVNLLTDAVTEITTNIGSFPSAMSLSPDKSKLFVGNASDTTISIIDTASNTASLVNVGFPPFDVIVSPDGNTVYVSSFFDASIIAYNIQTTAQVTIPTQTSPSYLVFTPDGTHFYVPNIGSSSLSYVGNSPPTFPTQTITGLLPNPVWMTIAYAKSSPVSKPQNLQGQKKKNTFFLQEDLINQLTWSPPSGAAPASYKIYRNAELTDLAGEVLASDPLIFLDHNIGKHQTVSYYVVSISASGSSSPSATTTISR